MTKTTPPRLDPAALAELLERTRQDVKRYRRLHPEWQPRAQASNTTPPDAPKPAPTLPASAPCSPGAGTGH
ncbi:hypothetical protein [Pseudomonas anguilliseptica]|uniref:hypothetical protein n=1 Tax=Pseudomonas anguilliseptica TaxID=53406 RepID=UPI001F17BB72|nr:hypothetical protein [Pseudomonas anguilliseptica]MCE5362506.1 hypothetical protein [Pseudomonas anguilliseptica]